MVIQRSGLPGHRMAHRKVQTMVSTVNYSLRGWVQLSNWRKMDFVQGSIKGTHKMQISSDLSVIF